MFNQKLYAYEKETMNSKKFSIAMFLAKAEVVLLQNSTKLMKTINKCKTKLNLPL